MNRISLAEIPTLTSFYQQQNNNQEQSQQTTSKILSTTHHPSQEYSSSSYSPNSIINDHVSIIQADITKLEVDAIVNAANSSLLGGGGVDGAVHSAAGAGLVRECRKLGGCETGNAKMTKGYNLPAKFVLHTVGPIGSGDEDLRNCYRNCLKLVEENDEIKSVAFCGIGTGIYGFPLIKAAHIAMKEVRDFLDRKIKMQGGGGGGSTNNNNIPRIIFCVFPDEDKLVYQTLARNVYFPSATNNSNNNNTNGSSRSLSPANLNNINHDNNNINNTNMTRERDSWSLMDNIGSSSSGSGKGEEEDSEFGEFAHQLFAFKLKAIARKFGSENKRRPTYSKRKKKIMKLKRAFYF